MSCCFCFVCPSEGSVAIIESCGKFDKTAYAGCHCVTPCFGQSVAGVLSLRVQQLDVRCETKTRDNVFVTLVISVQYQVQKEAVYDAFYKLTDSSSQISSYIFDVVRASVPKMNLDDVFEAKEEIAHTIKDELTKSMAGYGFLILHALVTDIEPAHKVKEAMNEINAAKRLRIAAAETAEAHKVTMVKAAEAESESKYLQGQGMARQRQAIIAGLRDSVRDFSTNIQDISSKDVLELMLITQYFDMLRDIGSSNKASTLFLPHSPAGLGDISTQIRDAFLQGNAAAGLQK
ncbi:hypothetical protein CEUSTIGMA_g5109.t1 [Chlamydomonas eustigma]|uniref:Band 7 domain-containing protein n=1 Tax=Chlamydomonas eustigma TaxID=1157962 RepID=A0A250X3M8_9CHLO|nr:hypothetical protein CEUSTIGMA_g5109.t1 [Chlamydomonas eustigma]|eukprot:GAX77666.1 hypothetical protein CEUSTIGMA_g5109.t1 [Chlamydomonas eustigma]